MVNRPFLERAKDNAQSAGILGGREMYVIGFGNGSPEALNIRKVAAAHGAVLSHACS
jgi:hypothetical protein